MDEEGLALGQPPALEDIRPDGEEGLGHRASLNHGEALWNRQNLRLGRDAVLSITATGHQGTNLIANLVPGATRPHRHDLTCDLQSRNVARAGRRVISSEPLQHVGPIDAGCSYLNQDLVLARLRHRHRVRLQHLRPAEPIDANVGHALGQAHKSLLRLLCPCRRA